MPKAVHQPDGTVRQLQAKGHRVQTVGAAVVKGNRLPIPVQGKTGVQPRRIGQIVTPDSQIRAAFQNVPPGKTNWRGFSRSLRLHPDKSTANAETLCSSTQSE